MNWVWPRIYNKATAMAAARDGAAAAFLVAGISAFVALLSTVGLADLTGPLGFIDGALLVFLGVMIRRMSRTAAVIMLALYVAERFYGVIAHGFAANIIGGLLIFPFFSAVRGAFAYRRYTAPSNSYPAQV